MCYIQGCCRSEKEGSCCNHCSSPSTLQLTQGSPKGDTAGTELTPWGSEDNEIFLTEPAQPSGRQQNHRDRARVYREFVTRKKSRNNQNNTFFSVQEI